MYEKPDNLEIPEGMDMVSFAVKLFCNSSFAFDMLNYLMILISGNVIMLLIINKKEITCLK